MINDEGGIAGRKIEYSMFDDGYNPAKTKQGLRNFRRQRHVRMGFGVGTACGLAVKDYLMEKKILGGTRSRVSDWITPPQKYLWCGSPLYYTESQLLGPVCREEPGQEKKWPLLSE